MGWKHVKAAFGAAGVVCLGVAALSGIAALLSKQKLFTCMETPLRGERAYVRLQSEPVTFLDVSYPRDDVCIVTVRTSDYTLRTYFAEELAVSP